MTSSFIAGLAQAVALAPSADNSQPWQLNWNGRAMEIRYAERHADTNVFSANSHATLLSIGAIAESIDTALEQNGSGGTWQWSVADTQPYGAIELADLPATFTPSPALAQRHTNRLPFRRDALPADLVERLGACREGGNRVSFLLAPAQRARLVRLVRLSSEARFCDRALHKWLFGSFRRTPAEVARGDGLDMATLGLPPGGKAMLDLMGDWGRMSLLNRLGAYKLLALSEVGALAAAPALLCVSGPNDRRGVIDAGRLLTRVWIELNAAGIAVQPYYVVTDQINRLHDGSLAAGFGAKIGKVEQEIAELLQVPSGEVLHMILRLGYPKAAPVRARRLELAAVFTDTSQP